MNKAHRYFAIFCVLNGFVVLTCLMLMLTGSVTLSIPCFAVDGTDQLYIGTQNEIRVYADGTLVNTINPQTSRAYMFTIDNEKIVLSTSSKLYLMDLDGTVLEVQDDAGADMYNKIQYKKRKFISSNGDKYQLIGTLGRTRIIKNNSETVYQISLFSLIVKIAIIVCVIMLFTVPVYILKLYKSRNTDSSLS